MRVLGLDIGDRWTGVAVSDPSGIICKPLKTVQTADLEQFLVDFVTTENVPEVVYGMPLTCMGNAGEQAKKTKEIVEKLKEIVTKRVLNKVEFTAWDERRTSKMAKSSMMASGRTSKDDEHSVAAAFILQNYMDFKSLSQASF